MLEKRKCCHCHQVYDYKFDEENTWENDFCSEDCLNIYEELLEYERRDINCLFNVDFEYDGWF